MAAVFLVLATAGWLLHSREYRNGRQALAAYEAELSQRGESLDILGNVASSLGGAEEENFATTPLIKEVFELGEDSRLLSLKLRDEAVPEGNRFEHVFRFRETFDLRRPLDFRAVEPLALERFLHRDKDGISPGEVNAVILEDLKRADAELAEISSAARRAHAQFPLEWEKGMAMRQPHLEALLAVSTILQLRGVAALRSGDTDAAFEDAMTLLRVARLGMDTPSIINLSISSLRAMKGLHLIWEGCLEQRWSAEQLREFETTLRALRPLLRVPATLRMERAILAHSLRELAETPDLADALRSSHGGTPIDKYRRKIESAVYPRGRFYHAVASYSRILDQLLENENGEAAQGVTWQAYLRVTGELSRRESADHKQNHPEILAHLMAFTYVTVLEPQFRAETQLNCGVISCALERFQIAEGRYPDSLSELQPGYLPEIPVDLITGQPLVYRLGPDQRPVVYSPGSDLKDDKGTPRNATEQGDWVWRYAPPEGFTVDAYFDRKKRRHPLRRNRNTPKKRK